MIRCLAACALVLAGCGRFGFDGDPRADAPAAPQTAMLASFVTSGATYVPMPVTLTIPPSPGARWLVLVSAALESTIYGGVTVEARYLVDGVEAGIGGTQNSAPARPGPWQHFAVVDGTESERTITFELREAQGGTATIHDLEVSAFPLPAGARFASEDALLSVTAEVTGSRAYTLSLGALDGDYAFLLLANLSDAPRLSDVYIGWTGPSGEPWLMNVHQPREPMQSVLLIERASYTGDATLELLSWATPGPATIGYVRALALPLAELPGFAYERSDATLETTLATPMIASELVAELPAASTYQYIATALVEEDCTNTPDAERGVHFVMGGDERTYRHVTDNCASESTYGVNRVFTSLPSRFAIGVSSGNGYGVLHRNSAHLVLALP